MSRPDPVDPLVIRKRNLLRVFYAGAVGCAIAFTSAEHLPSFWRAALLTVSLAISILAVWTLVRFLRVIDEFEALCMYGALRIAFVGTLCLLALEAFLESFGFPRVPGYGNASCAVLFWSFGMAYTSWRHHWRQGYEE